MLKFFSEQKLIDVKFEVLTTVTMKDTVFLGVKTQYIPHRKHFASPLRSPAGSCYVRFEVFTAVTIKNGVFLGVKTQYLPHRKHFTSPLQSPAR
jgi:hypothetical protein